jgi:UDP-N-acetylglucosamine 4,6-dehydratase
MNILSLIGRDTSLITDLPQRNSEINEIVSQSRFLVLGGAGSIGQAVVKEIFKRNPIKLHVVDISENNLVELVRDLRSSNGYIDGDFKTFALDIGSLEFDGYFRNETSFDYVLNLSALKHVRSERDPFTLMRMIEVNIINTIKTIKLSIESGVKKYFCVSTDKAANPVNMMGASKRIMEMFLYQNSKHINISTARFANVAFSDGSLLYGFQQRLLKNQPIAAPNDIRRYFVTPQESGEICLMSSIFGENGDIYFPILDENIDMIRFSEIATKFLILKGYEPIECTSEDDARLKIIELKGQKKWPCYFSKSDTTGEKEYEEFFLDTEEVDFTQFESLGIVKNNSCASSTSLRRFLNDISELKLNSGWSKEAIVKLFQSLLPNFTHYEKGKNLDGKM